MQVSYLGTVDYEATLRAMQEFVERPDPRRGEQLWVCQHPPVYTLGKSSVDEKPLGGAGIPVVQADRGGHITYHGPGQVVAYPLIDLSARSYWAREYVQRVEQAVLCTLSHFGLIGQRVPGAPGVYLPLARGATVGSGAAGYGRPRGATPDFRGLGKVAALGIKVRRRYTYHGVALNVDMDLAPFRRIAPCGYAQLQATDMASAGAHAPQREVAEQLVRELCRLLA